MQEWSDEDIKKEVIRFLGIFPRLQQFMFNGLMPNVEAARRGKAINDLIKDGTIIIVGIPEEHRLRQVLELKEKPLD